MTTVHAEPDKPGPKDSYSLADYGLTVEMVKERFAVGCSVCCLASRVVHRADTQFACLSATTASRPTV